MEKDRIGRTEQFAEIEIDHALEPGSLVRAAVTGVAGGRLTGRIQGAQC
jgi:threonylcarbamoyladenosine tRNA methylthiotransferase MtaB